MMDTVIKLGMSTPLRTAMLLLRCTLVPLFGSTKTRSSNSLYCTVWVAHT